MSEGIIFAQDNDGESWCCSCGTLNLSEDRHCINCEEMNEEVINERS
jgi:hypothetical protein